MQGYVREPILVQLSRYRRRLLGQRTTAGAALWLLVMAGLALMLWVAEGTLWLGPLMRTLLLVAALVLALALLAVWVVRPLLQLMGWWHPLDDMATALHVHQRDAPLGEQIITWLHLRRVPGQPQLLAAALRQKTQQLSPWDVREHLPSLQVRRALTLAAAAVFIWLVLSVLAPGWVGSVAQRWARPTVTFVPPLPYTVQAVRLPEVLVAGEPHQFSFTVKGTALPARLFLYASATGGPADRHLLQADAAGVWSVSLTHGAGTLQLRISDGGATAWQAEVLVRQRPSTKQFQLVAVPPAYTRVPSLTLSAAQTTAVLPVGTRLTWHLQADDPTLRFYWADSAARYPFTQDKDTWQYASRLMQSMTYHLVGQAESGLMSTDSVSYQLVALPDAPPRIVLDQPDDQQVLPDHGIVPLKATASDDYGISRAELLCQVIDSLGADSTGPTTTTVPVMPLGGRQVPVSATVDALALGLKPGQSMRVQLRVWDNDGVHGPKSAVSQPLVLNYRTRRENQQQLTEQVNETERTLGQSSEELKRVGQDLQRLSNKTLQGGTWNYEENRRLQQTLQDLAEVQQQGQDAARKLEELSRQAQQQQLNNPRLQEQLKQIEQLTQQLRDPELAKYLRELAQRWERLDQPEQRRSLERLEDLAQRYELSLQRAYELFKQWKVERQAEMLKELAQDLARRQNELQDATRRNRDLQNDNQLAQQQKQLAEQTRQLEDGLDSLKALKEQTRTPQTAEVDSLRQQTQQTQQQQQQATRDLQQHNRGDAQQEQQDAAENLQNTAQKLQQMQESARQRQHQENLRNLRLLLDNLLKLSFDQEELREDMQATRSNDPALKKKGIKQAQVQTDYALVNDSLNALAKRVPEIAPQVLDEAARIRRSMTAALDWLDRRNVPQVLAQQGLAMASINVLANSLADVQQQMIANATPMQGPGTPRPGEGGAEMGQLSKQQQEINDELKKLMQQEGQDGQGGLGEEAMQELAQRQEELRNSLEQYFNRIEGGRAGNGDRILQGVDETLKEFYNRSVSPKTVMRQELILNRMLELDRAERQRAYEEQRESQQGIPLPTGSPAEWAPALTKMAIQREQLNLLLRSLDPYYRELSDQYLQQQKP